jgi:prepilin-type N-terminal cleavage/methylation domain-containing protein
MHTRIRSEAGFSLPEVLITSAIMLVVLAGSFSAMTQAMKGEESTRLMTGLNAALRGTMDLVVRDSLQIGQGLPDARRIEVPNGLAAQTIVRPGPAANGLCPGVPADFGNTPSLPAITVGPGMGPAVNGVCSDVITTLAADGTFDRVALRAVAANGSSITVAAPTGQPQGVRNGVDIDDGGGDDIRVGDLIMLTQGSLSTLMYVTGVNGPAQQITFAAGDPFRLNQFDPVDNDPMTAEMAGTINQMIALGGNPTAPALIPVGQPNAGQPLLCAMQAARIRMITYFVDTANAAGPRLMRTVGDNTNTVAFGIEGFIITYDLVDGVNDWVEVPMTAADLAPGGACGAVGCSENQIRKVNLTLSMRSRNQFSQTRDFFRNALYSQVAVRSLAFVDKYK